MPELRKDPVVGRWVIISTERAKRPDEFLLSSPPEKTESECPFCEGNEAQTPPEITAFRSSGGIPNQPGWLVRVIPSIAPFLRIESQLERKGRGLYDVMSGTGAHEVIVETPNHSASLTQLPVEHIQHIIDISIERMVDLEKDLRFKYALLFKNHGHAAGEGMYHHSRSQIIALPINPILLKEELNGAGRYFALKERCLFCDIIRQELESHKRVAVESTHFVTLTPFASRFPFELCILPKRHSADFVRMDQDQKNDLAYILKLSLSKLSQALEDPPYNTILHTAPFRRENPGYWRTIDDDFHWHIEIMPRLTRAAGFEWGSGFYINPIAPEEAAQFLRDVHSGEFSSG